LVRRARRSAWRSGAAAGRDRPPGRTPGRRASDGPPYGGAPRRRLDSKCPPCAKRNKQLRKAQCREGWHLDVEPTITPDEPNEEQRWLAEFRSDCQAQRDAAEKAGHDTTELDAIITGLDDEINAAGMRGNVLGRTTAKRSRSTRRRQDAPDLPKRQMTHTTLGRTFQGSDGKVYRPSLFVTLTLPSYGTVRDGAPTDPDTYDYRRAARDALHFSKLVDRFVQNLRHVAGLMQRMGHDSVRAALIYQHSTAEADRKIADSMNDKINQSNPDDENGSSGVLARVT
jgi:hypothetical protein